MKHFKKKHTDRGVHDTWFVKAWTNPVDASQLIIRLALDGYYRGGNPCVVNYYDSFSFNCVGKIRIKKGQFVHIELKPSCNVIQLLKFDVLLRHDNVLIYHFILNTAPSSTDSCRPMLYQRPNEYTQSAWGSNVMLSENHAGGLYIFMEIQSPQQ